MRRLLAGSFASVVFTGTVLVLPVYASPTPDAEPIAPSIGEVALGSVEEPQAAAVVTTDGVVVDAGPEADTAVPAAGEPAPPVTPSTADDVASSGAELDGVPALTVAQSDTEPFSAVGVTWAHDPAVTAVTVQLRTRDAAGRWGAWTTVEQDDVEQEAGTGTDGEVRGGTAPVWTGESRGVEVIVQAADGTAPRDVQLQLIDPGTSSADAVPGDPEITDVAHAASAMPAIYSRAQWGADESIMGWDPEYAPTLKAATIHHTADSNNYAAADVPKILRSMYAYHSVSRGWGDIGYNVIVDKYGRAWEGRSGGLASTVVGAHAGGFNTGTFGVSMLGNYDVVAPPQVMLEMVASVIAWKLSLYGVDPRGTTTLVSGGGGTSRYPAGATVTLPTVFAHRDVGATACPGKYAYSRMGDVRTMVAARYVATAAGPGAPATLLRNSNTVGVAEWTTERGDPGDIPIACDWDGNGNETLGVFRRGQFFLFNSNATSARPSHQFWFGDAGDTPICGDWDGDGKDTVGVWRAGWFFLKNSNTTGVADGAFMYGNPDAQPVAGNWDGDPYDSVGVFQNAAFYYTNSNVLPIAAGVVPFGVPSDRALAGDWTGTGRDSVGVWRAGTFYFTHSLTRVRTDRTILFGSASDAPLVADWDGNRTTTIGVTRGY